MGGKKRINLSVIRGLPVGMSLQRRRIGCLNCIIRSQVFGWTVRNGVWQIDCNMLLFSLLSTRLEASFSPLGVTGNGLTELNRIMQSGFGQTLWFAL